MQIDFSHHAYALFGTEDETLLALTSALSAAGEEVRANPDFRIERFEVFGIDEARALALAAGRKGVTGGRKVFVVVFQKITDEAQNALLKVLEEPADRTHFFLVLPRREMLLPTVRSRIVALSGARVAPREEAERAAAFLSGTVPARLSTVQALIKGLDDETGGRRRVLAFLDALEECAAKGARDSASRILPELLKVKRYAGDRAPSYKLLLEHLALVI